MLVIHTMPPKSKASKVKQPPIVDVAPTGLAKFYGDYMHFNLNYMRPFNESKLLLGMLMILMNVGSKFVDFKFSKTQEQMFKNGLARELIVFAAVFMGTRDIIMSILLTAAFMILAQVLFHEESKYCVASDHMKKIKSLIDVNKDGMVSEAEEKRAKEILEKAERMRHNNLQNNIVGYLTAGQGF